MRYLSRGSAVSLAFAYGFLAASAARAAGPKDDPAVRAKRHDQLTQTQADLSQFCDTVRGWRIAGPSATDADLAVLSDPHASADDKRAAAKHIREVDGDAAGLADDQKQKLHMDVDKTKESCDKLEDADSGLPALTQDGVKLERITSDHWNGLTDKLGAVVLSFKGKDAFGSSSNQSYANCYAKGCDSKSGRQFSRLQLANDADAQFTTDFESVLPDALGDVSGSKADKGE